MSGTARTRQGEFRAAVTMAAATGWRGEGKERTGDKGKVLLDSEGREAKRLAVSAANNSN